MTGRDGRDTSTSLSSSCRVNNYYYYSHDDVYGAVVMTRVDARVQPVHLMNAADAQMLSDSQASISLVMHGL